MQIKKFDYSKDKKFTQLREIANKCGSKTIKETFGYLSFIFYHTEKEKLISEYIPMVAYYVFKLNKSYIRLIDIAISEEHQKKGIGRCLINRIIEIAKKNKKEKITLRTSSEETAFMFYQKLGFKEVGMKGNDIEMELIL